MERNELIEYLREHLSVEISLDTEWEGDGRYITSRVSISLDNEEIAFSCDSTRVDN